MNVSCPPCRVVHVPERPGVLEDAHLSGPEELFEAVGELIMDSVPECTEGDTLELCTRLFRIITGFVSIAIHPYCTARITVHIK